MPEAFSHVLPKSLGDYMKAQFHYWSEDEIACNFRKMLTLVSKMENILLR